MSRIICTLENASHSINGIAFHPDPKSGGKISENVAWERAVMFEGIRGFQVIRTDDDRKSGVIERDMVKIEGPDGKFLHVAGDFTAQDLEALRAHWAKGRIHPLVDPLLGLSDGSGDRASAPGMGGPADPLLMLDIPSPGEQPQPPGAGKLPAMPDDAERNLSDANAAEPPRRGPGRPPKASTTAE